jgi:hypothetical protein
MDWTIRPAGRIERRIITHLGLELSLADFDIYYFEVVLQRHSMKIFAGALPLVQELARHRTPKVREEIATRLYFDADKELVGRKDLLMQLARDEDAGVRAAAVQGLSDWRDQKEIIAKRSRTAAIGFRPILVSTKSWERSSKIKMLKCAARWLTSPTT